jgi:hypothetical protein
VRACVCIPCTAPQNHAVPGRPWAGRGLSPGSRERTAQLLPPRAGSPGAPADPAREPQPAPRNARARSRRTSGERLWPPWWRRRDSRRGGRCGFAQPGPRRRCAVAQAAHTCAVSEGGRGGETLTTGGEETWSPLGRAPSGPSVCLLLLRLFGGQAGDRGTGSGTSSQCL